MSRAIVSQDSRHSPIGGTSRWSVPASHAAYALEWRLPIAFPAFHRSVAASGSDVLVEYGEVPGAGPISRLPGFGDGPCLRFGRAGVARLLISEGRHILIDRFAGASDDDLRMLLLGSGVSLTLLQRGLLPLHGSSILTARGAVVFIGDSAVGKSTTLSGFLARGYPLISDDLTPVAVNQHGPPQVYAGGRVVKLWSDSVMATGETPERLQRVRADLDKYFIEAPRCSERQSIPLHAIYHLRTHDGTDWMLRKLSRVAKFRSLLAQSRHKELARRMALHDQQFAAIAAIANHTPVSELWRPKAASIDLRHLIDMIEADCLA